MLMRQGTLNLIVTDFIHKKNDWDQLVIKNNQKKFVLRKAFFFADATWFDIFLSSYLIFRMQWNSDMFKSDLSFQIHVSIYL